MRRGLVCCVLLLLIGLVLVGERTNVKVTAQAGGPEMLVPNLGVRTTIADLITPISMAFIGPNDFLYSKRTPDK